MFRIDEPHLAWCLESIVAEVAGGSDLSETPPTDAAAVLNRIVVDDETSKWALVALQRMLDIPGAPVVAAKVD